MQQVVKGMKQALWAARVAIPDDFGGGSRPESRGGRGTTGRGEEVFERCNVCSFADAMENRLRPACFPAAVDIFFLSTSQCVSFFFGSFVVFLF